MDSKSLMRIITPSNASDSPLIVKFKAALVSSESFNMLYKKIKDGIVTKS